MSPCRPAQPYIDKEQIIIRLKLRMKVVFQIADSLRSPPPLLSVSYADMRHLSFEDTLPKSAPNCDSIYVGTLTMLACAPGLLGVEQAFRRRMALLGPKRSFLPSKLPRPRRLLLVRRD
jgi:hypothetical protein